MNTDSLVFSVHWILMVQNKSLRPKASPHIVVSEAPRAVLCAQDPVPLKSHVTDMWGPKKGWTVLSVNICEYKY